MADNINVLDSDGNVVKKATRDAGATIGHIDKVSIMDSANVDAIGAVTAAPVANTLLGRIKAIQDLVTGVGPSTLFAAVTPSDSTDVTPTTGKRIYVGGSGNLTMQGSNGTAATFAVTAGQILPITAKRIMATGTTATGIVILS